MSKIMYEAETVAEASLGGFDRDTAVELRGAGLYQAHLSPRWATGRKVNGGYLLALVGRALGDALPHPHPFTVTAHYLSAPSAGAATIRTETARVGRTVSSGAATLCQPGARGRETECVRALATYGDLSTLSDDVHTTTKPPGMPPPELCLRTSEHPASDSGPGSDTGPGSENGSRPEMSDQLCLRYDPATCGWAVGAPSGRGEMRAWTSHADGRDQDPLSLLQVVDALPSPAFEMGFKGWVPTVELTVHVRAWPAPGPVLVSILSGNLAGGFLEEDVEVWDSDDRLVAQARQLARVARR
jgi:hypothetical protein